MKQYIVTGMSCAACSSRVEKAVSKVEGVTSCSVSLLTNSMGVEGSADSHSIIEAVKAAGYGASLRDEYGDEKQKHIDYSAREESLKDHETPRLKKRLIFSMGFLLVLMYFSMGHMMLKLPVSGVFADNPMAIGIAQLLLAVAVMVINQKFFINGFKGLIHKAPNMDTLVALGSAAAFIYSTYALFEMTIADGEQRMEYLHELYYESSAMILTLITVGKMLEARSKGKTTDALKELIKLSPESAVVLRNGEETVVEISQVKRGDIFVVRPGENIPVDGIVLNGSSTVNEAALTGESMPVQKEKGDTVSAATINQAGFITCEATRVGEDTTLSQIIKMVSDAAATKAPVAKIADKVSGFFVPMVIAIAFITMVCWLIVGEALGFAIARAISVLVISCPCALGLATPVAIMVGSGKAAQNGILFKTAISLEKTGKVQAVALDKTGTITAGEPRVTDIIPADGITEGELLSLAYALEQKSEHPLARAILIKAEEEGIRKIEVSEFSALPGNGLTAELNGKKLAGGSLSFIQGMAEVDSAFISHSERLSAEGKTPLFFASEGKLAGSIAVADVIKEDSSSAIEELKNMGIHVVMLTGDNEHTAKVIGKSVGVDEVIAGVLPAGKESVIRKLQKKYEGVAMVGDGINDAPALVRADIGIAIGAGTDVAIDAADVVLMKSRLSDVPAAIRLSRFTLKNIHENLFWAFFYNFIGIPLAAGLYYPLFGLKLNPMFGAAAMSLSSFCVVTNALRLNLVRIHDAKRDKKIKVMKKENKVVTRTMIIEGMMCGHCEARVKKVLEEIDGVVEAVPDHNMNTAIVTLSEEVADEALIKAVEDQDYKVISIK